MEARHDGRQANELRPLKVSRGFSAAAAGSVLIEAGQTVVLCTASVEESVPPWLVGNGKGWITAEYSMLPGSTSPRKPRERGAKLDGRTTEIQRLIGRSLRAVADLAQLGERTVTVDCDVLRADGGTRTLSITGGMMALVDALAAAGIDVSRVLSESVAAVSVGIVGGRAVLDLDYREDVGAAVDMNLVMTASGRFIEIQGTGEEATFSDEELASLLALGRQGIARLVDVQREGLGRDWPWRSARNE